MTSERVNSLTMQAECRASPVSFGLGTQPSLWNTNRIGRVMESLRRAPGARGKAREGEDRTRTRRPPRPGEGFSPPRAVGGYDRDGARGRNRQAAGASIPWPPLVPGARGRVPRESSGPATGAPRAGSARRAKVPDAANGVRAGRAPALQGGRTVVRERRSKIANRDSVVRSLRGREKAGRVEARGRFNEKKRQLRKLGRHPKSAKGRNRPNRAGPPRLK